ncbi:fatty acyl-CoA reductase wat-like [Phymastichus coffea]|uniref:fatty acyl-CoA reductase wat-like n=1 Tax=Phymastichus coffea TaxID=108790 RepID=UPI00273C9306|nr:fatty acyl-CoA reductase wat-like [Phymastichus coffea]
MTLESSRQNFMNHMLNMSKDEQTNVSGVSEVTEFFNGSNVFVTGGSGFLGKLLIDKLLRSCPKMGKLYMLMRAKKGKTSEERFKEHFQDVVYERLRKERPNFIDNVVMIEGDASLDDLGMSIADRENLIENTHVVFHAAATVRFDESLRQAVNINVRGTKLLLLFAKQIRNLKSFVYVSTAYSHCIRKDIEEKFYEPPMDPDKVLSLCQMLDDTLLEHMTSKILGKWPNTYAFSKATSEEIVRVYSKDIPTCIVRPSIVIATYREPMPGWINNYYGATGVVVGAGIGLLRSLHCKADNIADIIPADYVINNIIVGAYDVAKQWQEKQKNIEDKRTEEAPIYNSVSSCQRPISWITFMRLNEHYGKQVPSAVVFWYYVFTLNKHLWVHNLFCFLFHTIPAIIVDALAMLTGRKPMLYRAYQKIHKFSGVISYFCTQQWNFNNDNLLRLWERTSPVDREKYDFNLNSLDWDDYFYHHVRGIRVHILKDPLHTIEVGRMKIRRLRIAHYIIVTLLGFLLMWAIYTLMQIRFSS